MFSTGHKSGGFNDNIAFDSGGSVAPTYKPEVIYSTEIGSKNEFLDKALTANISAFWYNYRDLQLQTVQQLIDPNQGGAMPVTAAAAVRYNAANSRVLGVELEGIGRLPAGFVARASALVLDAKFVDGDLVDTRATFGTDKTASINGKFLPRAPVLSINYSLGQTIQTGIGYFDWIASAQTKSKQYMTPFNGEGRDPQGNVDPNLSDVVPAYTRLDLGVGYTQANGKLRLDAFINNVTNVAYMTSIINTPGLNLRFFNPPRQMGIRLSVFM
jgi:iron complex outermembrane receptor protein